MIFILNFFILENNSIFRAKPKAHNIVKISPKFKENSKFLKSLKERDYIDSTRKESPLKKADDAIELDTTNLTIEDVINFISKKIENNIN